MALKYYGGTYIECVSTDEFPDMPNGWFLKALDTGISYIRKNGEWVDIEAGLSFIKATKSGRITTGGDGIAVVVFNTPFYDIDYSIALSCVDAPSAIKPPIAYKYDRQPTGFSIITRNPTTGLTIGNIEVSWLCTRNYNP